MLISLLILSAYPLVGMCAVQGQWTFTIENGGATITASTATGAVTIPSSLGGYPVTSIGDSAFYGSLGLTSVIIPDSVTSIGVGAFQNCTGLTNGRIPTRFWAQIGAIGFTGQLAEFWMAEGLFVELALLLIPRLGGDTGVLVAVQQGITTAVSKAISLGIAQVQATPHEYNLFSSTQYEANRIAGQQDVIARPESYGLYTISQIQNMAVGDLVLSRQSGGGFVLNYDIEKSEDLQTWTTHQALSLPLTGLPTDKAFVRIKPKQ